MYALARWGARTLGPPKEDELYPEWGLHWGCGTRLRAGVPRAEGDPAVIDRCLRVLSTRPRVTAAT
jgi:hypothetical protein